MSDYKEIFANGVNADSIACAGELARSNIHFIIDCAYYATFYNTEKFPPLHERRNILGFENWEIPSRISQSERYNMIKQFEDAKPKENNIPLRIAIIYGTGGNFDFSGEAFKDIWDASFDKKYIAGCDPYDEE